MIPSQLDEKDPLRWFREGLKQLYTHQPNSAKRSCMVNPCMNSKIRSKMCINEIREMMKSHIWQVDLTPAMVDQTCFPISELMHYQLQFLFFFVCSWTLV